MIDKFSAAFSVFRKGQIVADPATWKNRAIATTSIASLIMAALGSLSAFGVDFNLTPEQVDSVSRIVVEVVLLGGALFGFGNVGVHLATSRKVGVGKPTLPPQDVEILDDAEDSVYLGVDMSPSTVGLEDRDGDRGAKVRGSERHSALDEFIDN